MVSLEVALGSRDDLGVEVVSEVLTVDASLVRTQRWP